MVAVSYLRLFLRMLLCVYRLKDGYLHLRLNEKWRYKLGRGVKQLILTEYYGGTVLIFGEYTVRVVPLRCGDIWELYSI